MLKSLKNKYSLFKEKFLKGVKNNSFYGFIILSLFLFSMPLSQVWSQEPPENFMASEGVNGSSSWGTIYFTCLKRTGGVNKILSILGHSLGFKDKISKGEFHWEAAKYLQNDVVGGLRQDLPDISLKTETLCKPHKDYKRVLEGTGADAIIFGEISSVDADVIASIFLYGKNFVEPLKINIPQNQNDLSENLISQKQQEKIPRYVLSEYASEISKTLIYGLDDQARWLAEGIDEIQDNYQALFDHGVDIAKIGFKFREKGLNNKAKENFEASLLYFERSKNLVDTMDRNDPAVSEINNLLNIYIADVFVRLGSPKKGLKIYRSVQTIYPQYETYFIQAAAKALIRESEYLQAGMLLAEILDNEDIDPYSYYAFGRIYLTRYIGEKIALKLNSQNLGNSFNPDPNFYFSKYIERNRCSFKAYQNVIMSLYESGDVDKTIVWLDHLQSNCLGISLQDETSFLNATNLTAIVWEYGYSDVAENIADFLLYETRSLSSQVQLDAAIYANFVKADKSARNWNRDNSPEAKMEKINTALDHYREALGLYSILISDPENPKDFYVSLLLNYLKMEIVFGDFYLPNKAPPKEIELLNELKLQKNSAQVRSFLQNLLGIMKGEIVEFPESFFQQIINSSQTDYREYQTVHEWVNLKNSIECPNSDGNFICDRLALAVLFTGRVKDLEL